MEMVLTLWYILWELLDAQLRVWRRQLNNPEASDLMVYCHYWLVADRQVRQTQAP